MAYESLAADIDKIEALLAEGRSIRSIAEAIGKPSARSLIGLYKRQVFDINAIANTAWLDERRKTRSERMEEGKERIVDDLELLNLMKLRSEELLDMRIGDPYETAAGESRAISPSSASKYWEAGGRVGTQAIKQSQEISGDDPTSRHADVLEELSDNHLRAIIAATENQAEP